MSTSLTDDEFPNQLSSVDERRAQEQRHRNNLWRSNYHEASIYIEEGLNNDKFENHPRKRATLAASLCSTAQTSADQTLDPILPPSGQQKQIVSDKDRGYLLGGQYTTIETYILVHNRYFYQLDLVASVVLLLLALVEPPAVEGYELSPNVHAAIEMFALGIIAVELLLKFRWMGPKRFFHHGRTVTKLVVLVLMNVEAIVIFLRHSMHARYSRALRPIFLIDNHYSHGVRRSIRQIFLALPPILDMFTLAMFFMFVFSIFGFYLFATSNPYFSDMPTTVGNLLVLATTANLPDVFLPSYAVSRWSTVYYILFIIVHLFLLTNLTMAAVYESFTRKEKEKFHKLLLHRRKACQEAFKLLVTRRQPDRIQCRQFMGLMRYLNRKCSMFDAYLIFKALNTGKNGSVSLDEFYQIYDFINLEWKLIYPETRWFDEYDCMPKFFKYSLTVIQKVTGHRYFEWTIDTLIVAAAFLQFVEATAFDLTPNSLVKINKAAPENNPTPDSISTTIFICVFTAEALVKCLSLGLGEYWNRRWNRFDLFVVTISMIGLFSGYIGLSAPFGWVIVMRVLRLMRLFEFKRRYKDIWQTLTYILLKRFLSMTCVVMIMYYFFGIIGMELLSDYDLKNCCKNTSLESQFRYDVNSSDSAKYYLNDFGDLIASYLTLFSMSSNTYWLVTMNAYAIVLQTNWIRLFFGFYYLCSIIVMNIVIAFILESFLFRIHYRSKMGDSCDDTNLFTVRVTLSSTEVEFLRRNLAAYTNKDKNLEKMVKTLVRENLIDQDDERLSLLGGEKKQNRFKVVDDHPELLMFEDDRRVPSNKSNNNGTGELDCPKRWYLIWQAETLRNKFSFTMKMYADEVAGWLAEAEQADQDEMSAMISRNQIRAEHVAMARLVRRNTAAVHDNHLLNWTRSRSYSTSGGLADDGNQNRDPAKDKARRKPP